MTKQACKARLIKMFALHKGMKTDFSQFLQYDFVLLRFLYRNLKATRAAKWIKKFWISTLTPNSVLNILKIAEVQCKLRICQPWKKKKYQI